MLLTIVRSGLGESTHEVDICAIDAGGNELLTSGDPGRAIYYRSTVKPFQATIALEAGLDVPPEHLGVVAASHGGWPAHLAVVGAILVASGLDDRALQTPPSWPTSAGAKALIVSRGGRHPRSIYHNCSGKHAGMLSVSAAAGWPTESYLDPGHPLNRRVRRLIATLTRVEASPEGVDHCGAPATRGSVRGLARAFSALTVDDRFADVADAMSRFPALVADNDAPGGRLGRWWGGPVKTGAEGAIGISRHGIGIAAKARSGNATAVAAAAVIAADRLGMVSDAMRDALADVSEPVIFGGGRPVGAMTVS